VKVKRFEGKIYGKFNRCDSTKNMF